jgi:hypothetical protein
MLKEQNSAIIWLKDCAIALEAYPLGLQAKRYIELYQKVLAHQSSRSGAIG